MSRWLFLCVCGIVMWIGANGLQIPLVRLRVGRARIRIPFRGGRLLCRRGAGWMIRGGVRPSCWRGRNWRMG